MAAAVHFQLPVSFRMVRQVVEQGQCISENSTVHRAVSHVHPFCTKMLLSAIREGRSVRLPVPYTP